MAVSSRVLRKIRGDDSILNQQNSDESDVDDTILHKPFGVNSNVNRYGLLNGSSESETEVKEIDEDDQKSAPTKQPDNYPKTTKKKQKKKRQKPLVKTQKPSKGDLDEVERSVREVNAILGDAWDTPIINTKIAFVGVNAALAIEKKHLNPKNELRKMFGSEAVQSNEGNVRKRNQRGHIKRLYLMPHITHQMPYDPIQSMKMIKEENGILYFKYEHDSHYQSIERKFRSCVELNDKSEFVMIGNRYPLHVNTLIQLAETFAMSEEYHTAAKFIERALFALEIAFHPSFNILKGNCRLSYQIQENRALYIALFKHMMYQGEKACYRTALELSKVLFSLCPDEDPLAVVLAMDLYAIRSGQYRWLLNFIDEIQNRNLCMLPNMAYSQALAYYFLNELEKADELLQNALIMLPAVLIQLLEKCHISPDARTLASSLFTVDRKEPGGYTKLSELFVIRSHYVWKDPAILRWLEKNTLIVLDREDKKDARIAECATKRAALFPRNLPWIVQRHFFLSGVPFQTTSKKPLYLFDPIPPSDSVDTYLEVPRAIEDLHDSLSLFLRSMAPTYTPRVQQEPEAPNAVAVAGAAAGAGASPFMEVVNDLQQAVSNLLNNLLTTSQNYLEEEDSEE